MIKSGLWPLVICLVATASGALADEFRPALLEITESEPGWYAVTWNVPLSNGEPFAIAPKFPEQMKPLGPPSTRRSQNEFIEKSLWRSGSDALVGGTIEIEGLTAVPIDVIVQIRLADGSEHSAILRPASPSYVVPERSTKWTVAASYWKIGTIHILEGQDHLLFVLALLLIVPNLWMLFKTITAFTVAHSVIHAQATNRNVNMPGPPTEAVIALSILFLAVEIMHGREGRVTLTEKYPWVVALAFGLVHGLGFAGALAEVGLPQQEIPIALLMFNVGVETGQILFVCAMLLVIAAFKKVPLNWPQGSWRLLPYTIGSIAAFWILQRIDSFV
jgi:hydrogenase/urease accessory protein HupE